MLYIQDIYIKAWYTVFSVNLFPHPFLPQTQAYQNSCKSLYFLETKKLPPSNCSFGRSKCLLTMYHMYKASPKHCCQSYQAYNLHTSTQSTDFPHLYSLFSAFISSSSFKTLFTPHSIFTFLILWIFFYLSSTSSRTSWEQHELNHVWI